MTETPQAKVARLQHAVDQARIDDLQRQLAAAQAAAGEPVTAVDPTAAPGQAQTFTLDPEHPIVVDLGQDGGFQSIANLPPEVRARMTPQVQQLISAFQPPPAASEGLRLTKRQQRRSSTDVAPLAPAPRKVPCQFKAVVLPWSWWTVFALFMIAVTPIALWIGIPLAGAVTGAVTFIVIVVLRIRRDRLQLSLLKRGQVATVVSAETVSVGSYYSGVTYQNVRLAQAHGWQVTRQWYSGPGTSTKITYHIGGKEATMALHGLPYDDGVILADPNKPDRALCVSSFAYDLDRDGSGNWVGKLPTRVVLGSVLMTLFLLAWTAAMIGVFTLQAMDLHRLVR